MSKVTDIILITSIDNGATQEDGHPNVDILNSYLMKNHNGTGLVQVDGLAGGNKALQSDVFIAAINHLDLREFILHAYSILWEYPEDIQLLIKREDDDKYRVYEGFEKGTTYEHDTTKSDAQILSRLWLFNESVAN